MKISIDKNKCVKCGLCASICPAAFVLGEDGIVITYDEGSVGKDNGNKLIDDLKMAEKSCPVGGIKIEEEPIK